MEPEENTIEVSSIPLDENIAATSIDGLDQTMAKKSRINCCVYNCHAIASKNPNFSFHAFPSDNGLKNQTLKLKTKLGTYELVPRRTAWVKNCYSGKEITKFMKVCSRHFVDEDYFPGIRNKRICLKNTSIPTLNMPKPPYYLSPNAFKSKKKNPSQKSLIYDPKDIGKIKLIDMNTSKLIPGKVKLKHVKLIRSSESCGNFGLFVAHELSTIKSQRLRNRLKELIRNNINCDS